MKEFNLAEPGWEGKPHDYAEEGWEEVYVLVKWVATERHVAFLGSSSQDTYHRVKECSAYADEYGRPRGRAESCAGSGFGGSGSDGDAASADRSESATGCEELDLLVAWELNEDLVTSDRMTWGGTDDPTDRQVFAEIDETLEAE